MKQIEVLTMEQFQKDWPQVAEKYVFKTGLHNVRFCKVDREPDLVVGTFAIPPKQDPSEDKITFGYCIVENKLIFIDDSQYIKDQLEDLKEYSQRNEDDAMLILFDFMEYLIKDDMITLVQDEEYLTKMEEDMLGGEREGFEQQIFKARRDLSSLRTYYDQLSDMGETLQQHAAETGNDKVALLFGLYAAKTGRLYSRVELLQEYTAQLREMHQSQIDIRQNNIMRLLTIVTTIFMPLTLVAGWYGMNFAHMPELQAKHGYLIVAIVCALIIIGEIIIFSVKKWFK